MAERKNSTVFWRLLFLAYCAIMLCLLLGRSNGWIEGLAYNEQLRQNANLQPFFTIRNYWYILRFSANAALLKHCLINLVGNIILFIPAGWLFPVIWPKLKNFFRFFALAFGLIFLIETAQLLTLLGSFDVDDIILNLFGMTTGHILYAIFRIKKKT